MQEGGDREPHASRLADPIVCAPDSAKVERAVVERDAEVEWPRAWAAIALSRPDMGLLLPAARYAGPLQRSEHQAGRSLQGECAAAAPRLSVAAFVLVRGGSESW